MTPPPPSAPARQEPYTPEELLTVPQVMDNLKIGRSAVYNLLRSRRLASITIGRSRRIPTAALTAYLNYRLEEAS